MFSKEFSPRRLEPKAGAPDLLVEALIDSLSGQAIHLLLDLLATALAFLLSPPA